MTPTSEVVARLEQAIALGTAIGARGQHPTNIYNVAADALALISSLVAERDAALDHDWVARPAFETAIGEAYEFRTRALTAERLLAEARAASEALNVTDQELVRINNMCVGHDGDVKIWSKMLHKLAVFAMATRASIGGGNG
jgi:hypothetical protein